MKLTNESWETLLPTLSDVDLILIDPPYGISRKFGEFDRPKSPTDFGEWDVKPDERLYDACWDALKIHGTIVTFYDWKAECPLKADKFKVIRQGVLIKPNPIPTNINAGFLNSHEVFACGVKGGKGTYHRGYELGVFEFSTPRKIFHTTPKPLGLIEALIETFSNEGDVVVDCFSGSGTTAIACINTNREFIGCEINPEYYEQSLMRINAHKL